MNDFKDIRPGTRASVNRTGYRPQLQKIIGLVGLAVLAVVAFALFKFAENKIAERSIKKQQYQAVLLTGNVAYFGHLSKITDKYLVLKDVYYLQVQQAVQPADTSKQPQISLVKLGNEIHGPEDVMNISRDQVLFWENLKNDSKVVEAISNYKKNQSNK